MAVTCLTLAIVGCSGARDGRDLLGPGEAGTIVVDARLIVGRSFPRVHLRTTQAVDKPYDVYAADLHNASVWVIGPNADTVAYFENTSGGYDPVDPQDSLGNVRVIAPETTYRLLVRADDARIVTAETTTPERFRIRDWVLLNDPELTVRRPLSSRTYYPESVGVWNRLVYQDGLVEARFDRGSAIAFQAALHSEDEDSPLLIDADFLSAEEIASIARDSPSPPFEGADGFLRLPWLAVYFEGRYSVEIYSVDQNWYDVIRSTDFLTLNFGFGHEAGDDFERPVFHINGGIGLFGSASVDDNFFIFEPRP
jgi:hypothetical protein